MMHTRDIVAAINFMNRGSSDAVCRFLPVWSVNRVAGGGGGGKLGKALEICVRSRECSLWRLSDINRE